MVTRAATSPHSPKLLRILAFGDSLTEGYYNRGRGFHPYTNKLHSLLQSNLAPGCKVHVNEQGVSGERVLDSMQYRLAEHLKKTSSMHSPKPYDWVLILAGINDLWQSGPDAQATAVIKGLVNMYETAAQHGAQVLSMSVMGIIGEPPHMVEQRIKLNDMLRQYAADNNTTVHFFDLASKIAVPASQGDDAEHKRDDEVHMTPKGYDLMGELIFDGLKPHIGAWLQPEDPQ
eukprot:jgi/Chrzof1/201/Cz01g06250.t1